MVVVCVLPLMCSYVPGTRRMFAHRVVHKIDVYTCTSWSHPCLAYIYTCIKQVPRLRRRLWRRVVLNIGNMEHGHGRSVWSLPHVQALPKACSSLSSSMFDPTSLHRRLWQMLTSSSTRQCLHNIKEEARRTCGIVCWRRWARDVWFILLATWSCSRRCMVLGNGGCAALWCIP